jgi:hypothetical protein
VYVDDLGHWCLLMMRRGRARLLRPIAASGKASAAKSLSIRHMVLHDLCCVAATAACEFR